MNRSGAPANCWLLCMKYVCYILNHIACGALNGSIPLLVLYGITPDISIMLLYAFYQPVFYATHDHHYPSESEERAAFWVGFGEHCGDAMTHKLLDKITQKIIYRSAVRPITKSNPMELPLIFPLCCYIHFFNLYFMLHMTSTSHQKVKKGELFG